MVTHKFKIGDLVRPSVKGIKANLWPKTRCNQTGIVMKVGEFNCPIVLWEGRETASSYHPDFIALHRRQKQKRK